MPHPLRSNPPQSTHTGDFFHSSPTAWAHSPKEAFEVWMDNRGLATSSRAVYRTLWAGFVRFLDTQQIDLGQVDATRIHAYLEGTDMKLEQRERVHRLIERAFIDITGTRAGAFNPASKAAVLRKQGWRAVTTNDDTDFLDEHAYREAVAWIESAQPPKIDRPQAQPRANSRRAPGAWRHRRDMAICAVLLGGGLKPSELRHLSVNEVHCSTNGIRLHIQPSNNEEREVELQAFATPILRAWLATLATTVPGAAAADSLVPVFLSAPAGGALTVRAVENTVARIFGDFPYADGPVTPQLLRNSFAAALFARDVPLETVQELMGYRQELSVARLHGSWRMATGA